MELFRFAACLTFIGLIFGPAPSRTEPWRTLPDSAIKYAVIGTPFDWRPTGAGESPLSTGCRRAVLEKTLETEALPAERAGRLRDWLDRCEPEITRMNAGRIGSLLEVASLDHPLRGHPALKKAEFTLSDGRKLNVLLAFKPGDAPRPLVIAKCGLYCDANETVWTRMFFMHLFEESPFHLAIVASSSGSEFSIANQAIAFGGFDEGYQLLEVARQLRSPESSLAHRISSVHAVGVSMGSQGVLYASIYDSQQAASSRLMASATAICPVVDLGRTIQRGFSASPRGFYYRLMTLQAIRQIFRFVPVLGEILNIDEKLSRQQLRHGITEAAVRYYATLTATAPWGKPPFADLQIRTEEDLWRFNRFQDFAGLVRVPTMVVHMKNDDMVESRFNSEALASTLEGSPNPQIGVVGFSLGNHCGLAAANGWETMSTLLRSLVLAEDHEARAALEVTEVEIGPSIGAWRWPRRFELRKDQLVARVAWRLRDGETHVQARFTIFDPYISNDNVQCWRFEGRMREAEPMCLRTISGPVPLSLFNRMGLRPPRAAREAIAMTRWLNTNSDVLSSSGQPLIGSSQRPARLVTRGRFE